MNLSSLISAHTITLRSLIVQQCRSLLNSCSELQQYFDEFQYSKNMFECYSELFVEDCQVNEVKGHLKVHHFCFHQNKIYFVIIDKGVQ